MKSRGLRPEVIDAQKKQPQEWMDYAALKIALVKLSAPEDLVDACTFAEARFGPQVLAKSKYDNMERGELLEVIKGFGRSSVNSSQSDLVMNAAKKFWKSDFGGTGWVLT